MASFVFCLFKFLSSPFFLELVASYLEPCNLSRGGGEGEEEVWPSLSLPLRD